MRARDSPLQPGQPALVVADADAEKPWSLYQIQIQTEDNDVWWYQSEALRPGHPSVKERMRREAERYQLDMQQRELDEMRIEEIMVGFVRLSSGSGRRLAISRSPLSCLLSGISLLITELKAPPCTQIHVSDELSTTLHHADLAKVRGQLQVFIRFEFSRECGPYVAACTHDHSPLLLTLFALVGWRGADSSDVCRAHSSNAAHADA